MAGSVIAAENVNTLRSLDSIHILNQNLEHHVPLLCCMATSVGGDYLLSKSPKMPIPTDPVADCRLVIRRGTVQQYVDRWSGYTRVGRIILDLVISRNIACFGRLHISRKDQSKAIASSEFRNKTHTAAKEDVIVASLGVNESLLNPENSIAGGTNDHFVFRCELSVVSSAGCSRKIHESLPAQTLMSDLKNVWNRIGVNDTININVAQCQFKAHKSILAARSPVFAAMFQHDTKEMLNNTVAIQDIDSSVFQLVLQYIYTDDIEQNDWTETNALILLPAADKYMLQGLKLKCEDLLIKTLTLDNCGKYLKLGDTHSADGLKSEALKFVKLKLQMNSVPKVVLDKLLACPDNCRMLGDLAEQQSSV